MRQGWERKQRNNWIHFHGKISLQSCCRIHNATLWESNQRSRCNYVWQSQLIYLLLMCLFAVCEPLTPFYSGANIKGELVNTVPELSVNCVDLWPSGFIFIHKLLSISWHIFVTLSSFFPSGEMRLLRSLLHHSYKCFCELNCWKKSKDFTAVILVLCFFSKLEVSS